MLPSIKRVGEERQAARSALRNYQNNPGKRQLVGAEQSGKRPGNSCSLRDFWESEVMVARKVKPAQAIQKKIIS